MLIPENPAEAKPEGWREQKRRQTLQRITDSALRLFAQNGYEATTLDAIAAAAGISRRTFFYYFKSKEEILAAWQKGLPEAFRAAILAESSNQTPFEVVCDGQFRWRAGHGYRPNSSNERAVPVQQPGEIPSDGRDNFCRLDRAMAAA